MALQTLEVESFTFRSDLLQLLVEWIHASPKKLKKKKKKNKYE